MAGVLDEFDDATPMTKRYCSRITKEEYDHQTCENTESALEQLLQFLDQNPDVYASILKKKRKEEAEPEGLFSYFKHQFLSFWSNKDSNRAQLSDEECQKELGKLKQNMIKAYEYSQEAKGMSMTPNGRRFSQRLLQKKLQSSNVMPPPPPPPPPLPPVSCSSSERQPGDRKTRDFTLQRKALHDCNSQFTTTGVQRSFKVSGEIQAGTTDIVRELQGSGGRKRLRKTASLRSPGGTPIGGWPKSKARDASEIAPLFNQLLLQKFTNVRSPSPTTRFVASPGAFDSPVMDKENSLL